MIFNGLCAVVVCLVEKCKVNPEMKSTALPKIFAALLTQLELTLKRVLFCSVIEASSDSVTVQKRAVIESLLFWTDIESLKWAVIKSFCKMSC